MPSPNPILKHRYIDVWVSLEKSKTGPVAVFRGNNTYYNGPESCYHDALKNTDLWERMPSYC
jgi:hypothetical protein